MPPARHRLKWTMHAVFTFHHAALLPYNPPYMQSYLPHPSRRHGGIRQIVFTAWAAAAVRRLQADDELHIDPRAYVPQRCVTLHMYDLRAELRGHMIQLYDMLWELFEKQGCNNMLGIIGVATTGMSLAEIKLLSYKGACYKAGYWSDLGNFVYYLFWLLLGCMAKHTRSIRTREPTGPPTDRRAWFVGKSVTDLQRMVRQRWPRDPDSKRWSELVGDLLEMALGCGYLDTRFWNVIADISPIMFKIKEIVEHIDCQGAWSRIGENCRFCRGAATPYARKLSTSIYNAMLVHKYRISSRDSGDLYIGYRKVATTNKLMYGNPMGP